MRCHASWWAKGVRDQYTKLIKDVTRKRSFEERASGICPDEHDELDQALEELLGMEESQQEQLQVGEKRKRAELDKDRATAESMRKRSMERMGKPGQGKMWKVRVGREEVGLKYWSI